MFGSKIISDSCSATKERVKSYYHSVINIPIWSKNKVIELINYFNDCRYKFAHLKETNFELGMEHLYKKNLNDALLRFKFVDKFLAPSDSKANYWLGWTYFLKNNYVKALGHLQKSSEINAIKFVDFLQNNKNYTTIPGFMWTEYRDLISQYYPKFFLSNDNIHLPYSFAQKILHSITELPENYTILELGSNIGIVGYELRKRFPDHFTLTGVEESSMMNKLLESYYPNTKIYDEIFTTTVTDFIKQRHDKFHIIISFCGLAFTSSIKNYFDSIHVLLRDPGYFAFCLPTDQTTYLSLQHKEFVFNIQEIEDMLTMAGFSILNTAEFTVAENYKYCMVTCKKNK